MNADPLMIFAAGRGTRMGALTDEQPKPMIEVGGRRLIDHALAQREGALIARTVANVHHVPDRLITHLGARGVLISDERDALLETGGGLRKARPLLAGDPVLTLNSDAVWKGPPALAMLQSAWDPERMDGLLLLVPGDRALGHKGPGDFKVATEGQLQRGPGAVYTGAQIIKTAALDQFEEPAFSLNLLWDVMLAEGRLFGLNYPGHWCDVGQPDSIPIAEELLDE